VTNKRKGGRLDEDALRHRLTNLKMKTGSATKLDPAGFWVGDQAGERKVLDDWAAGRLEWRSAYTNAVLGLQTLDNGDAVGALEIAWIATDYYISAIERRIRPSEFAELSRSSQRRGRPKAKSGDLTKK
jgi:hypothetical protein